MCICIRERRRRRKKQRRNHVVIKMKKLKQFAVNNLQFLVKRVPFNYDKFWRDRYNTYGFNILYSGNKGISIQENIKVYNKDLQIFFNLIKKYDITKNNSILDIGCGIGMFARGLKQAGYINYNGIDLNNNIVNDNTNYFHNGFKFKQMDMCKEKLNGKYNLAFMINVTQHITKDKDFEFIMSNIRSLLNENGIFLTTDADKDTRNSIYIRWRKLDYYKKILGLNHIDTVDFNDKKLFVFRK